MLIIVLKRKSMKKEYHIVYGEQANAVLQESQCIDFSNSNIELITLRDNLNEGKLFNLKTLEGIDERIKWIEDYYGEDKWSDLRREDAKACKVLLENIQDTDLVYIWLGNDSSEYVWKALVIDFLKELKVNIFVIDWHNVTTYNVHGKEVNIDYLNICQPENAVTASQNFRHLKSDEKQFFIELWQRLLKNNAEIRNLNNGVLEEGDVRFFDAMLLARCKTDFQTAAYVVGMTLGDMYFKYKSGGIGDFFLYERLEQLAKLGKLEIAELVNRKPDAANWFKVRLVN